MRWTGQMRRLPGGSSYSHVPQSSTPITVTDVSKARAELLKRLGTNLTSRFGRGGSKRNLELMRR